MRTIKHYRTSRAGVTVVYMAVILSIILSFISFAIDYGRVQIAKTELRCAVDAAARSGSRFIVGGQPMAFQQAAAAAANNNVDGSALVLASSDVEVGNWNTATRVFTPSQTPITAIRVSSSRTVNLTFGAFIGKNTCRVTALSVVNAPQVYGIVGLDGVTFKNNTYVASYNSSVTTNPTHASDNSNGVLASNSAINGQNNNSLNGIAVLGPGATVSGFSPTSGTVTLPQAMAAPADPSWNPAGNPGGLPAAWVCNSNTSIAGGTYWFTSLTVNANVTVSAPATIYVNGNIDIGATVTPSGSLPANLTIYQLGTGRTFTASGSLTAYVIAPGSAFSTKNNFTLMGGVIFDTIDCKNNTDFYYDESLGAVKSIALVK